MSRVKLTLFCQNCRNWNYFTSKNKKLATEKIVRLKYCRICATRQEHHEKEL